MKQGGQQQERRSHRQGRLDHLPRATDKLAFNSSFGTRFGVFVDTEEEFDWTGPRSRTSVATTHIQHLPEFQRLAEPYGISPCYLVDYPVVDDPQSAAVLRAMLAAGGCDIGTQLHPWVNPPFDEDVTTQNSFVGNLSPELERAKLEVLTRKIEEATGRRPVVYRAGRYGIGPNTADILLDLGYKADLSVRPTFDYRDEGGPDFTRHDSRPFWAGRSGELLELPLGVSFTGGFRKVGKLINRLGARHNRLMGSLARSGLLSRVALTPEDMPVDDVKRAIDAMLADGFNYLSFSFHSPSLAPGHTPYVRNSAELSDFYIWWERILSHLAANGVKPASIGEVLDAASQARTSRK